MQLPRALTSRDLPEAELRAAALDGEVFRHGAAWCAIDEHDGPALRIRSLAPAAPPGAVAELRTAAWVWEARASPPARLEFCLPGGVRAKSRRSAPVLLRQSELGPADRVDTGGGAVTAPLRTALDLVRVLDRFEPVDATAVAALLALAGADAEVLRGALRARRNLPFRERALARLDAVAAASGRAADGSPGQPAETRYTS